MNSQHTDSITQSSKNSSVESHVWTDLIYRGVYRFSVVAATSKGAGEAANLTYDTQRSK